MMTWALSLVAIIAMSDRTLLVHGICASHRAGSSLLQTGWIISDSDDECGKFTRQRQPALTVLGQKSTWET